jgi:hypothetical protein
MIGTSSSSSNRRRWRFDVIVPPVPPAEDDDPPSGSRSASCRHRIALRRTLASQLDPLDELDPALD